MFAIRDLTLDELAQQQPLVRFGTLTLVAVGELRAARLPLEATGRSPQHLTVVFDDLEAGIAALVNCVHRTFTNPYYEE